MKKSTKIMIGAALMASLTALSGCRTIPQQTLYGPAPSLEPQPTNGEVNIYGLYGPEPANSTAGPTIMPQSTEDPTPINPPIYGPPVADMPSVVPEETPEDIIEDLYGPPPVEREAEE